MSCMMMKLEPMAALANAIETRLNCDLEYWGFEMSDQLHRAARDCRTAGSYCAEEIYQRLYALNVRAYNSRYKDVQTVGAKDEDAPVIDGSQYIVHRPPVYREHGFAVCPWHYQLAALLDFWIYQTDEGTVAKEPLRMGVVEFRDKLYQFIVQNSPEYFSIPRGELPNGRNLPCGLVFDDHDHDARDAKCVICRPVGGITINSEMEFVLDNNGGVRVFDSMEQAKRFLRDAGCTEDEMEHMRFLESCGTCFRCGSPLFPSLLPNYTYQCFTCDEDFYGFEQEDCRG